MPMPHWKYPSYTTVDLPDGTVARSSPRRGSDLVLDGPP